MDMQKVMMLGGPLKDWVFTNSNQTLETVYRLKKFSEENGVVRVHRPSQLVTSNYVHASCKAAAAVLHKCNFK